MQNSLEAAMVDVMAEMDLCTQLKATLEQRMGKVHDKQGLNDARQQVGAAELGVGHECLLRCGAQSYSPPGGDGREA